MLARESRVVSRVGRGTYVARTREGDDLLVDLVAEPACAGAVRDPRSPGAPGGRPARQARSTSRPACRSSTPRSRRPSRPSWRRSCATRAPRCSATARRAATSALRELVADAWRRRGHHADPEAILVTTSGQQAIDLAVRALVEPGDVVLCETPTYAGAVDALVASRARIVPIPVDANGLRVDAVADAIRLERPRLLFANPTGNNATGTVLSDERRQRLASLSAESGLVILEDDTGAELVHDGPVPAPVAAFDPEAPMILVKSYAEDGAARPAPRRDPAAAAPRPPRAGGEAGRRPLHVAAARARAGRLPRPARGGPAPGADAAPVPRAARRASCARSSAGSAAAPPGSRRAPGSTSGCGCPTAYRRRRSSRAPPSAASSSRPGHTYVPPGVADGASAAVVLDRRRRPRPTAASRGSRSPCATRSAAAGATARSRASEPIRWRRAARPCRRARAPRPSMRTGSRCT